MRKQGGQGQHPGSKIDRRGLNDGDLMLAKRLAHDLSPLDKGA
jgi:hypothetical protein